jgi:hypothetical protein
VLDLNQVFKALELHKDTLVQQYRCSSRDISTSEALLTWLAGQDRNTICERLQPIEQPGALPTIERQAGSELVHPFSPRWNNHPEAREWARHVLNNVQTCAVDGSHITPNRDFSVPVGAVQVGCFVNDHCEAGVYSKTLQFEVLTNDELAQDPEDTNGFPDQQVNLRRFQLECRVLRDYMMNAAGREPRPLCFFDGSFILSFAGLMRPDLRQSYMQAITATLDTSRECGIPIVGYVDSSYARDLVNMLRWLSGQELAPVVTDANLLAGSMKWGDRSELWQCARADRLATSNDQGTAGYYHQVHFLYLRTTSQNPPVRLELPDWVLQAGIVDSVLDIVRAECVVGAGYPYAVETADALAVITLQDRERFYRLFQDYLVELKLPLRYTRKAYSKQLRR